MPLRELQSALLPIFKTWGVPQWIKVDNGRPFGDPQMQAIPVLALWLIALDIGVIWNRPRMPQDNAKVERSQGVLANWTEWRKCKNAWHLQARLWEEACFHNLHYPVQRLKGQTRLQAFPQLLQSPRPYQPADFDPQRALDLIAQGAWKRQVSKVGQINMWNQVLQVGAAYRYQTVSIKLDPAANQWNIFDANGVLIKAFAAGITAQKLWALDLS